MTLPNWVAAGSHYVDATWQALLPLPEHLFLLSELGHTMWIQRDAVSQQTPTLRNLVPIEKRVRLTE